MNIDETNIIEDNNEQLAMACLLAADICFIVDNRIYVNLSDTFAYACADCEAVNSNDGDPGSEIISLYSMWKENERFGYVKWSAIKRKEKPLVEVCEWMKNANYWDDVMENLPDNYCNKQVPRW